MNALGRRLETQIANQSLGNHVARVGATPQGEVAAGTEVFS